MRELNAVAAIAARDLLKFMRDPGRLVAALVFPFVTISMLGGTLQLNLGKSVGINFIAFYAPKSELSDVGKDFAKRYQAKFNEPPVYAALNGFANAIIFAAAIEKAKSTDPKAMIKALEEGSFMGWSTTPVTFPRAEGALWHNCSPPLLVRHYTAKDQTPATAEVAYVVPLSKIVPAFGK